MYQSEQLDQLFTALAKAQAEMPVARKISTNPFFKSKYADLEEVVTASRPCLSKHGLSVTQPPVDETNLLLVTILGHSSGQWIKSTMRLNPPKADAQALGGYITYMRRYAYSSITGVVVADEDDDGNSAVQQPAQKPQQFVPKQAPKIGYGNPNDPFSNG